MIKLALIIYLFIFTSLFTTNKIFTLQSTDYKIHNDLPQYGSSNKTMEKNKKEKFISKCKHYRKIIMEEVLSWVITKSTLLIPKNFLMDDTEENLRDEILREWLDELRSIKNISKMFMFSLYRTVDAYEIRKLKKDKYLT